MMGWNEIEWNGCTCGEQWAVGESRCRLQQHEALGFAAVDRVQPSDPRSDFNGSQAAGLAKQILLDPEGRDGGGALFRT